jgi:hypothetical protein
MKVTTIFIFSFFTLIIAPSHFYAEAEPPWVAVGGGLLILPLLKTNHVTTISLNLC